MAKHNKILPINILGSIFVVFSIAAIILTVQFYFTEVSDSQARFNEIVQVEMDSYGREIDYIGGNIPTGTDTDALLISISDKYNAQQGRFALYYMNYNLEKFSTLILLMLESILLFLSLKSTLKGHNKEHSR